MSSQHKYIFYIDDYFYLDKESVDYEEQFEGIIRIIFDDIHPKNMWSNPKNGSFCYDRKFNLKEKGFIQGLRAGVSKIRRIRCT